MFILFLFYKIFKLYWGLWDFNIVLNSLQLPLCGFSAAQLSSAKLLLKSTGKKDLQILDPYLSFLPSRILTSQFITALEILHVLKIYISKIFSNFPSCALIELFFDVTLMYSQHTTSVH